jgi:hypothetical protein
MICPRCEGQKYDVGTCQLCDNTGEIEDPEAPPIEGQVTIDDLLGEP